MSLFPSPHLSTCLSFFPSPHLSPSHSCFLLICPLASLSFSSYVPLSLFPSPHLSPCHSFFLLICPFVTLSFSSSVPLSFFPSPHHAFSSSCLSFLLLICPLASLSFSSSVPLSLCPTPHLSPLLSFLLLICPLGSLSFSSVPLPLFPFPHMSPCHSFLLLICPLGSLSFSSSVPLSVFPCPRLFLFLFPSLHLSLMSLSPPYLILMYSISFLLLIIALVSLSFSSSVPLSLFLLSSALMSVFPFPHLFWTRHAPALWAFRLFRLNNSHKGRCASPPATLRLSLSHVTVSPKEINGIKRKSAKNLSLREEKKSAGHESTVRHTHRADKPSLMLTETTLTSHPCRPVNRSLNKTPRNEGVEVGRGTGSYFCRLKGVVRAVSDVWFENAVARWEEGLVYSSCPRCNRKENCKF